MLSRRDFIALIEGSSSSSGWLKEGVRPYGVFYGDERTVRRGLMRGNNVVVRGKRAMMIPRVSERDYLDIVSLTTDVQYDEVKYLLSRLCHPESDAWKNYLSLHVASRKVKKDGDGAELNVVLNPNPLYAPPAELRMSKAASSIKVKKYTLAQIFCDSYLADKYMLSTKFRRDMQILAVTRPYDAAATLRETIQAMSPGVKILVEAGGYSKTRQQAMATVRNLSYGKPLREACVVADIIGAQAVVYGPGDIDRTGWMVQGPTKHMEALMDVHKLVTYGGLRETMFLLSMETLILGIEMYDGKDYVSPTIISHAPKPGVMLPTVSDPDTLDLLNEVTLERFQRLSVNIRPVLRDGISAGSSVQIGPRMVLINEHLKDDRHSVNVGDVNVNNGGVPLTHDLWMHHVSGVYAPWSLRSACVGETVAILYHNGTDVLLSPHFNVVSSDESLIISRACADVIPGMSGGALVALSDMSLLGLHSGEAMRSLFASAFTDTMNLDLMQLVDRDEQTANVSRDADALLEQMQSRGLRDEFLSALFRLVGLETDLGDHVGSAMAIGGKLYTTCLPQEYLADGVVENFLLEAPFVSTVASSLASKLVQENDKAVFRSPHLHEKVVVVCKRGEEVYFSRETVVKQMGAGGKNFYLRTTVGNMCSLTGGIVVSVQDSAILGMFVRDASNHEVDGLSMCVPFPVILSVQPVPELSLKEAIQSKFPMVHVSAWSDVDLEDAFTHSSAVDVGRVDRFLSVMGKATAVHALYNGLRRAGVSPDQWLLYEQQLLGRDNLASVFRDLQLGSYVRGSYGLVLDGVEGAGSDILLALIQVIADHEDHAILDAVLGLLGLVSDSPQLTGPGDIHPRMMRRPSELGFRAVDLDGGTRLISPVD